MWNTNTFAPTVVTCGWVLVCTKTKTSSQTFHVMWATIGWTENALNTPVNDNTIGWGLHFSRGEPAAPPGSEGGQHNTK